MQNGVQQISDFFSRYRQTAFEKDIPGMISLYDDDVLVFDMWEKGYVSGITAWSAVITDWLSSLKKDRVKVDVEMIDIHENKQLGVASAIIQFQAIGLDDSVLRSMKNRLSVVLVKKEECWKVKHQHTSVPVDFQLKAILEI